MLLETCAVAITGLLAGGLINMIADALPSGQPMRMPRYADGTQRPVRAWLGIGAFSLNLRSPPEPSADEPGTGSAALSWRYPLTELASALLMLFFFVDSRNDAALLSAATLFELAYAAIFVLITVIDLEYRRIPFVLSLALGALALLDAALNPARGPGLLSSAFGGLLGFGVVYAAYLGGLMFCRVLSRERGTPLEGGALGFGDVVLMAATGLIVGFPSIALAIVISVFAGAAGAIVVILRRIKQAGGYRPFASMPYGPYIIGSAIAVMLTGG